MAAGRLRQQIAVGVKQVGELHSIAIRVFAGMKNVPVEVYGFFGIRQDGRNPDLVPVLNFKIVESFIHRLLVIAFRHVDLHHRVVLVCDHAFHLNVPEGSRGQHAASQLEGFGQALLIREFINRWVTYHTFYRHCRTHRWDLDRVS